MARLWIKSSDEKLQSIDLKMGANRFGRHPDCDFQIDHPSVSALHCEIHLGDGTLSIRDCNSTNGTFLDDAPVTEAKLQAGQKVRLGDVTLLVESADVTVAIPHFDTVELRKASVQLPDGTPSCENHPDRHAIGKCTKCEKVFCNFCLHDLHIAGKKHHKLCPVCSGECVPLEDAIGKKKPFTKRLRDTLKLPFKLK